MLDANPTNMSSSPLGSLLQIYATYRIGVTLILWLLFFLHAGIGDANPALFYASATTYLAINSILLVRTLQQWQPSYSALFFTVLSDVLLLQLIARSSGSYDSGGSILLLVAIAAGSMFMSRHYLLLPAIATISVLSITVLDVVQNNAETADIVASGWLSIAFFVIGISINYLTRRLQRSEKIAASEAALAKRLEQLNSVIIERMQTGIIVINHHSEVITFNSAARQLLNVKQDTTLNLSAAVKLSDINDEFAKVIEHWQASGNLPMGNTTIETNDSATILQLTPVLLDEGNQPQTLIFVEDMAKIAQQAQQLKLSSLGKLTASIAHEIRNPVGAISHAAQLLQLDAQEDQEIRLTDIICQQTKRCSNIIDSVMSVSRGKAGTIEQFELTVWLGQFVNTYCIDKTVHVSIQSANDILVRFDKAQLEQILTNLLDNALQANAELNSTTAIKLLVYANNHENPVLEVLDQGKGVDQKDKARLFEPFFTTGTTGSGLGLYICRELCRANQATITYGQTHYKDGIFSDHCFRIQFSHPDRTPLNPQPDAVRAV
jgi:two-component system sensor histidine kinase PilS (NtrC family)